jgi:hypothetical protein
MATSAEVVQQFEDLKIKASALGLILTAVKKAFYLTRPSAKQRKVYRSTNLTLIAVFLEGWEKKGRMSGEFKPPAGTGRMGCLDNDDPRGEQ